MKLKFVDKKPEKKIFSGLADKLKGVTDPSERINIINFAKQNEEYDKVRKVAPAPKAKPKVVEKVYGSMGEIFSEGLSEDERKSTKGKTAEKAAEDIGVARLKKTKYGRDLK